MRFTCSQIVPWSTLIRAQFPFTATAFLHFSYTPPHFYSLKHFRHMWSSDIMIIFIMEKSQSGLRLNTANWFSKSRKSRQNFPKLNELESELCRWQVVGLFVSQCWIGHVDLSDYGKCISLFLKSIFPRFKKLCGELC